MSSRQSRWVIVLGTLMFIVSTSVFTADKNKPESRKASDTTTVYKVTRPDGSISFSDQPREGARKIEVPPVITVPAFDVRQNRTLAPSTKPRNSGAYYQNFSITSPANGAVFYSGNGNIPVRVAISPRLRNSDSLVLLLDGQVMATQRELNFQLKHVDRGSHVLILNIIDRREQTIKSTVSEFMLHRPKIKRSP